MQLTNATSQDHAPALPDEWVERIFQRMENFYMSKWVDSFGSIPRERVKRAWAEELSGYSGLEIKKGLEACRSRQWPPTLPEFLMMCRPGMDAKTEWAEACEQMRLRLEGNGADVWSRPGVYWAAVAIGWYDLNSTAWEQIKTRWTNALTKAKSDPIPEYLAALPAPGQRAVTRDEAGDRMKELLGKVDLPGTTKAGTAWAYRLMQREAAGEQVDCVAAQFWREALGYQKDADAKTVLEAINKTRAAA